MYAVDLSGKIAVVMGVANKRSLAWGVAEHLNRAGARVAFTYVGEKFGDSVRKLSADFQDPLYYECDVQVDEAIDGTFEAIGRDVGRVDMVLHSVAFAPREEIADRFITTSRSGFKIALDVSAYSFIRTMAAAAPLMETDGGSALAMTYFGANRVVPKYNVMGSAKAALEHAVRQLAYELGPSGIRVNALSAGPINTLSARGLRDLSEMLRLHQERAPLKRNITLDEVAKSSMYLLSDLSSGVTGEVHYVDGGYNIIGF